MLNKLLQTVRDYEDQILTIIIILSVITRYSLVALLFLFTPIETPLTPINETIGRLVAILYFWVLMGVFDYQLNRRT